MKDRVSFGLTCILLLAAVLLLYGRELVSRDEPVPPEREFSRSIGGWTGRDVPYDREVLGALSADQIVYQDFQKDGKSRVTLFVALYQSLEKTDFSHSPVVCFTGQGWKIERTEKKKIPLDAMNTRGITVNQLVKKRIETRMITLFWYQCDRGAMGNRGLMKLSLLVDRLMGRSDRNAFVRVTAVVPENESSEEIEACLSDFVRDLYPPLSRFILAQE